MVATKRCTTLEKIKLYGVQLEGDTIKNSTACEEMEHCRFFHSNMFFEVMHSFTDTNTNAENKKNDAEVDISKYISFCIVTLKTAILLTEGVFDHHVNNCIFQEILGRKIASVEKDSGPIYTENTVDAFISGISMVTCIEVWKIFLVQRDAGTTNQKQFQPVLNVFGFEYNSMNFELEAEHMLTEIFTKMSLCKSSN